MKFHLITMNKNYNTYFIVWYTRDYGLINRIKTTDSANYLAR